MRSRREFTRQAVGMDERIAAGAQPLDQGVNLAPRRRAAEQNGVALEHQRRAGRVHQHQQVLRRAGHVVDEFLGLAKRRQDGDQLAAQPQPVSVVIVLDDRFDAQRKDLAQLFAGRADLEGHEMRRHVMAGNHAPEPALDHQRNRHRGQRLHVLHVLQVYWRHRTQAGEAEVGGCAGFRVQQRRQARRFIVGVGDQAHMAGKV